MPSLFRMVLIVGHSKQNADNIREWLAEHPQAYVADLIDDWRARGYLTADDARGLLVKPTGKSK
jgi:hypothetical protein